MARGMTALLLSALAMSLIVGVRYLIASGAFAYTTRRLYPALYRGLDAQIRREIGWSLASAAIYGIPAGIVAWGWQNHGWTRIYTDPAAYPWWYMPVSVLLYLVAHDSWFYWTHRWMHAPRWFRLAHAVHHASRPPTAWAAMSFHPIEALTGAIVIPVLVFLVPIHVAALGIVLGVMTLMGVTNHIGWEVFPDWLVKGRLGNWLINADASPTTSRRISGELWPILPFLGPALRDGTKVSAASLLLVSTLGAASAPGTVDAGVEGLRSGRGQILACMTTRADLFHDCRRDPQARRATISANGEVSLRFTGLPSGDYALSLIHDENSNNKLDTMMGIPREGFGFSRNPAIRFGPPSFASARFTVVSGEVGETVRVKYLL